MKLNLGTIDRVARLIGAVVIGVLYFTGTISGTLAIILGVIGVIFLVTGAIGFCPLYLPFKLGTKKN